MSHPDSTHFNDHHRRTAQAILSHPVSHNIEWHDVLSLLEVAGEVSEEHNGKFKVTVGGETETLHRPRGKDVGEQMVVDLRRMLRAAGMTVEGYASATTCSHGRPLQSTVAGRSCSSATTAPTST